MTNIVQDLRTFIAASTPITAIVGTRIHYNQLPQDSSREHIWYRLSSDTEDRTLDKAGGLHDASFDLECSAETEDEAQDLSDVIKARLDGYQGAAGNASVQAIFMADKDDSYDARLAQDKGVHTISFDLRCFYTT